MPEFEGNYYEAIAAIIRRRREKKKFLSQFWIWQPYSKYSLSEAELIAQGYKNLGDAYPQKAAEKT